MKKYVIVTLGPLLIIGLAVVSVPWLLARMIEKTDEKTAQDLASYCVERGYVASWSVETGFLSSHVKFTCLTKASSAPAELQHQ